MLQIDRGRVGEAYVLLASGGYCSETVRSRAAGSTLRGVGGRKRRRSAESCSINSQLSTNAMAPAAMYASCSNGLPDIPIIGTLSPRARRIRIIVGPSMPGMPMIDKQQISPGLVIRI